MQLSIKPYTYIALSILLFTIPLRWFVCWIIAVAFHEICHLIAVKSCGGEILSLSIGVGGAEIQCGNMTEKKNLLSVLLGPVGGLLLACFGHWLPGVALCSFILSVYNLIPVLPMDGGRALCILFGERKWVYCFQNIMLMILFVLALLFTFLMKLGLLPVTIVAILYLKHRKIPCKESFCKVQ